MKEKMTSALGAFGMILFYLFLILISILPLIILDLPFWADALILTALFLLPFSDLLDMILWIVAAVVAFRQPIDWVTILFYVVFVVYIVYFVINLIRVFRGQR